MQSFNPEPLKPVPPINLLVTENDELYTYKPLICKEAYYRTTNLVDIVNECLNLPLHSLSNLSEEDMQYDMIYGKSPFEKKSKKVDDKCILTSHADPVLEESRYLLNINVDDNLETIDHTKLTIEQFKKTEQECEAANIFKTNLFTYSAGKYTYNEHHPDGSLPGMKIFHCMQDRPDAEVSDFVYLEILELIFDCK
jgi:hypothetical protein